MHPTLMFAFAYYHFYTVVSSHSPRWILFYIMAFLGFQTTVKTVHISTWAELPCSVKTIVGSSFLARVTVGYKMTCNLEPSDKVCKLSWEMWHCKHYVLLSTLAFGSSPCNSWQTTGFALRSYNLFNEVSELSTPSQCVLHRCIPNSNLQ